MDIIQEMAQGTVAAHANRSVGHQNNRMSDHKDAVYA